jgi:hypothetical protein
MFSADLSWNDDTTEKVGERRQRKVRDGTESINSSNSSQNKPPPTARKPSLSGKTSFSSVKGSFRRPASSGGRHARKNTLPPIDATTPLKDPLEQPDWILSGKFIPKLPSGTPLDPTHDPPPPFLPELNLDGSEKGPEHYGSEAPREHGRILYSRQEKGSCRFSETQLFFDEADNNLAEDPHRPWAVFDQKEATTICRSYEQVKDEIFALQTGNPDGLVQRSASSRMVVSLILLLSPQTFANESGTIQCWIRTF